MLVVERQNEITIFIVLNITGNADLFVDSFDYNTGSTDLLFDASEDLNGPLPWKVVPGDQLMEEALALAERLCRAAPLAARATKEVAVRSRDMGWTEAVRFGETMRRVAGATHDATEGRDAWRDKRPPEWEGR